VGADVLVGKAHGLLALVCGLLQPVVLAQQNLPAGAAGEAVLKRDLVEVLGVSVWFLGWHLLQGGTNLVELLRYRNEPVLGVGKPLLGRVEQVVPFGQLGTRPGEGAHDFRLGRGLVRLRSLDVEAAARAAAIRPRPFAPCPGGE
jgi:hypothetical protein